MQVPGKDAVQVPGTNAKAENRDVEIPYETNAEKVQVPSTEASVTTNQEQYKAKGPRGAGGERWVRLRRRALPEKESQRKPAEAKGSKKKPKEAN